MGNWKDKCYWSILLAILAGSYLLYSLANAEGQFFDSEIKFFEMDKGCKGCPETGKQAKKSSDEQITEENNRQTPKITLTAFISLDSPYTKKAVSDLVDFKRNHSDVFVRGVVILPLKGAKKVLLSHTDIWKTKIPFHVDFALKETKAYRIKRVPSFVFENTEAAYKIAGQPDLEKTYHKCFPCQKTP